MRGAPAVLAALCLTGWGPAALACTMVVPMPREGETFEQAEIRMNIEDQRRLAGLSDAVFLASARYDPAIKRSRLTTLKALVGRNPPARMKAKDGPVGCSNSPERPAGQVVVFAQQIGIREDFWRPWRWGRWVAIGWRPVDEVVDPNLRAHLRRPA